MELELLPKNLEYLKFGSQFDDISINKILPQLSKLKFLKFGSRFNQKLTNFPPNLIYLHMGYCFNHPLDNLPITIKYIKVAKRKFTCAINVSANVSIYRIPY